MSRPQYLYDAIVLYDYEAQEPSEINASKGQLVKVRDVNDLGWSLVKISGKSGWIPTDFIERIEQPEVAEQKVPPAGSAVRTSVTGAPVSMPLPSPIPADIPLPTPPVPVPAAAAPAPAPAPAGTAPAPAAAAAAAPLADPKDTVEALNNLQAQQDDVKLEICFSCKLPIADRFVVAKDRTFHVDHFTCTVCHMQLSGFPFIERDDQFYCEDDFYAKFNPPCAYCNDVIKGRYITALGQSWHPDHFVCSECNKPFTGNQFRKHDDKPYCDEHYNKLFGTYCTKCNELITDHVFEALGKKFHLNCFVCEHGAHPIGEKSSFHVYEEKVYCPQHFEELFVEKCTKCSKPILSTYVKVANELFHPQCWCCANCDTVINRANCESYQGKFVCQECFTKLSTATSTGLKAPPRPPAAAAEAVPAQTGSGDAVVPNAAAAAPSGGMDTGAAAAPGGGMDTGAAAAAVAAIAAATGAAAGGGATGAAAAPAGGHADSLRPPSLLPGMYIPDSPSLPTPALNEFMQQENTKAGLTLTHGPMPGYLRAPPPTQQQPKGFRSSNPPDAAGTGSFAHVVAERSKAIREAWRERISLTAEQENKDAPSSRAGRTPLPQLPAEEGDFVAYTLLKSGPLPPHVDPTQKEQYLSDGVFEKMFKMTKLAFAKLKPWKQKKMKEAVGLF